MHSSVGVSCYFWRLQIAAFVPVCPSRTVGVRTHVTQLPVTRDAKGMGRSLL